MSETDYDRLAEDAERERVEMLDALLPIADDLVQQRGVYAVLTHFRDSAMVSLETLITADHADMETVRRLQWEVRRYSETVDAIRIAMNMIVEQTEDLDGPSRDELIAELTRGDKELPDA